MFTALVHIGPLPVGPTCARKHGLVALARRKVGMLRLDLVRSPVGRRTDDLTMDLFDGVVNG